MARLPPTIIGRDPDTGYALISGSDPAIIDYIGTPFSTIFNDPPMLSHPIEDWKTCPGTIINVPMEKLMKMDESETGIRYSNESVVAGDPNYGGLLTKKVTHAAYNPNKSYEQIIAEGAAIEKRLAAAKKARRAAAAAAAFPPREHVDPLANLMRHRECLAAAESANSLSKIHI